MKPGRIELTNKAEPDEQRKKRRFLIVRFEEWVAGCQFGHANGAPRPGLQTHTCLCYPSASGH